MDAHIGLSPILRGLSSNWASVGRLCHRERSNPSINVVTKPGLLCSFDLVEGLSHVADTARNDDDCLHIVSLNMHRHAGTLEDEFIRPARPLRLVLRPKRTLRHCSEADFRVPIASEKGGRLKALIFNVYHARLKVRQWLRDRTAIPEPKSYRACKVASSPVPTKGST